MRKSQQRGQTMSPIHPSPAQQAKENLIRRSIQRMSAKRGVDIKKEVQSALGNEAGSGPTQPQPMGMVPSPMGLGRRASKNSTGGLTERQPSVSGSIGGSSREYIIRSGLLGKKGVISSSWKKRFFILTNKSLYYYPDNVIIPDDIDFNLLEVKPRGKIDVDMIIEVERETKDAKEMFQVLTASRGYKLKSEDSKDAEAWIAAITGSADHAKSQHHIGGGRRESVSSLLADELDAIDSVTETAVPSSGRRNGSMIAGRRNGSNRPRRAGSHIARKPIESEGESPHTPADVNNYIEWGRFDVAAWLHNLDLGNKYSELFYQNDINGQVLRRVLDDQSTLIDIGVEQADVATILAAVKELEEIYEN